VLAQLFAFELVHQNPPRAVVAKRSTKPQVNKAPKAPALAARDYETVVLVLQGGGALGAYQCGVYEGLDAAGIRPDWFAGISIGAINAALLAGNAPEQRVESLREFWQRISTPALPLPPQVFDWQRQWLDALPKVSPLQSLTNSAGALTALLHGMRFLLRGHRRSRECGVLVAADETDHGFE